MITATDAIESLAAMVLPRPVFQSFYAPELNRLWFGVFMLVFGSHVTNALGAVKRQGSTFVGVNLGRTPQPRASLSPLWLTVQDTVQSLNFSVCLFFWVSSFLITRLLLIEHETKGRTAIKEFCMWRGHRIWPLYFTFLAIIGVASYFLPFLEVTRYRVWAVVLFASNWAAVLHSWSCVAIQLLWSVLIEERFYILWPNCARFGKMAVIVASYILVAISLLTLLYLGKRAGTEGTQILPNTLMQCLFFAGGAMTACLLKPEDRRSKLSVRFFLVFLGFASWVVASTSLHIVRTQSPGPAFLNGVAGWSATPIPVGLRYLGKISYGLYVFHTTCPIVSERVIVYLLRGLHVTNLSAYVTEAVSASLALVAALLAAMLSYKYLESPFLRLKDQFTVVPSRAT